MRDFDDRGYRYIHIHTLDPSVSRDELEAYRLSAQDVADEFDCPEVKIWSFDENGKMGFRFGSNNFLQFVKFQLVMFGDAPSLRNFVHVLVFKNESSEYQDKWILTAESFLRVRKIPFHYERIGNEHLFKFDRRSHQALFFLADTEGCISELVETPERPVSKSEMNLGSLLPGLKNLH